MSSMISKFGSPLLFVVISLWCVRANGKWQQRIHKPTKGTLSMQRTSSFQQILFVFYGAIVLLSVTEFRK